MSSASTAQPPWCSALTDRGVLRLAGKDTRKFLQGLTTNDVDCIRAPNDAQYAAFLNPKGRVIQDALVSMSAAGRRAYAVRSSEI
jgi:folate-binding Fe-S cluster repair protein YgfZ